MRNSSPKLTRIALAIAGLFCCGANPLMAQTVIGEDSNDSPATVTISSGSMVYDTLILGNTATGEGTLNFSGGTLDINHAGGYSGYITVGNSGIGTINHSNADGDAVINITGPQYVGPAPGVSPDPWGGYLFVGRNDGSTGQYLMTDSQTNNALTLTVQNMIQIGGSNVSTELGGGFTCTTGCTGTFVQGGGTVTASGGVGLGYGLGDAGGTGSYTINSGTLTTAFIDLGNTTMGNSFTQNGGDVNAASLIITNASNLNQFSGTNTYTLNSGTLDTTTYEARIGLGGRGDFVQTGGTHNANLIKLGEAYDDSNFGDGRYIMSGGVLSASNVWVGADGVGTFTLQDGTVTVSDVLSLGKQQSPQTLFNAASNGTFNMSGGVLNTGDTIVGENTIGVFNQSGGTHMVNGQLSLGSGGVFAIEVSPGVFNYYSSGTYNLSGDGVLNTGRTEVSGFGMGLFAQSGTSEHNLSGDLVVGSQPSLQVNGAPVGVLRSGEYQLQSGQISVAGNTIIGAGNGVDSDPGFPGEPGAQGTFSQSGGTHFVGGNLKIGQSGNVAGGTGLYTMSSGVLTVSGNTFIGGSGLPDGLVDGVGTFTQTGGTHTTGGDMNVGGGLGTYNLSGTGILNTGITYLNSDNGTSFNQSGGTHNTGNLNVYGGDYNLSGGTINVAGNMGVLGRYGGSARFSQDGGDVFVNDTTFGLYVGGFVGAGNTGTYTLNTGTLTVVATTHVGSDAVGTFNQTGGTHTTSHLVLGENIGGQGTYNLSGGTLNDSAIIGDAGIGVMNTSGGTHNVTGDLILGNQASGNGTYNLSSTGQVVVSGSTTVGNYGTGDLSVTGGSLSTVYRLTIGAAGNGTAAQSGASTVTAGGLRVGEGAASNSSYTMNGGTLNVLSTEGVNGGSRIGLAGTGTFTQNAGTHNTTYIEIGGTNFAQGSGGTGVYNLNGGTLVSSGAISTNPQGGSSGTLNVAGGTLTAPVIINKDTVNYSGGSITASINNSANVNVSGGAARILTGDLSNNSGGTVTVAAATPLTITGVLTQAAGASIKSDANITVGTDYNNVGAGSGNSFDRHAGVTSVAGGTFTSQIIGNNAAQTITGNVASGGTDTFTLDLGNVRGGSGPVTKIYQIANNGTGADIRGAIQTAGANGGNITDGRLSGTGVTAGNFGPIAAGANSGDLAVTLSGPGVALTGQKVAIVSNFDNVSTQIINLTGGAVSALAVGNATPNGTPTAVNLGNFRLGTAGADSSFNVQNQTSGAGAEQLGINSAVASSGFSANNAFGSGLIAPGATANGAITAKASGSGAAGVNNGTVTINYATDGTNIDASFARQAANQQVINVQATGYNAAVGSAAPGGTINLGNFHVGQAGGAAPQSQGIDITNTVAWPFTESLGVGTASVDNAAFNLSNSIGSGLVAAGATSNGALSIARAGGTAGVNTGTVTIQYTTDGAGTSGLAAANANQDAIGVNATGYRLASANTLGAVAFGNVHVGDTVQQALSITNTAIADTFSEKLNASFGASSDVRITISGSINQLAAGSTNASSMIVGLNTSAAGTVNGTQTINFASDGAGTSGLGITALASQTIGVSGDITTSGNVYRLASASPATPNPVNFGNVRINTATDQALSITNTAANDGFSESLNASISTNGAPVTASGAFNLLGPQATNNTSLHVGIDTSSAGAKGGSATIALVSDGTGTSGLGTTNLTSQTVNVSGDVYRLATGSASVVPVDLGAFRVGGSAPAAKNLSVTNTAANDGFSEQLGIQSANSGSSLFAATNTLGSTRVNAGASAANAVSIGTGSGLLAGVNSGTVTIQYLSDGTASGTGAPINSNSQNVNVNATGYNMAVGSTTPTPVVLNARVGDTATQALTVANTAVAGIYSEALNANFSGATGSAGHNGGSVGNLVAGGSNNSAMSVSLNTGTAGTQNGTVTLAYQTDGTGPNGNSGLAAIAAGTQTINVSGKVYTAAAGQVSPTVDFGIVHVGDVVAAQGVSVQNSAPVTALNDMLKASIGAATGPFSTNGGNVAGLTAGDAANTTALTVGLNTSTAGIFTGGTAGVASIALASHNPDMSDLALPSQDVTLTATVNNYANALFGKVSGAGTLSNTGSQFILNFGNVVQGSAALQATLNIENAVAGPADLLNGGLALVDGDDFASTLLLTAFSDVVAGGNSGNALSFLFNSATLGAFQDVVTLSWFGHNGSGYQDQAQLYTLLVQGNVIQSNGTVPEPGTLLLLALALAGLLLQRRYAVLH